MSLSSEGKERGKVNLKRREREREKERNACFPKEPYNMKVIFNF
jgi:hypothetical protein